MITDETILAFFISIGAFCFVGLAITAFNDWVRSHWPQVRWWPAKRDSEIWFAITPLDMREYTQPERIESFYRHLCGL